jgi:hypothetical protein
LRVSGYSRGTGLGTGSGDSRVLHCLSLESFERLVRVISTH